MAAINSTRTNPAMTAGILLRSLSAFIGQLAAWNDARMTRKSLSKLSARELDDIGLCYGDIDSVASGARR